MQPADHTFPRGQSDTPARMFSTDMRLAELIDTNHMLLPVIERLGIGLGFNEKTVGEACSEAGISTGFFLLVCGIHTFDGFVPSSQQLGGIDPMELISYLHNSHEYYTNRQIPRLKDKLDALVSSCHTSHFGLLSRFFDNYRKEVQNHFRYEEETVFPYVRELTAGNASRGYSIETFGRNHDNIDEKLDDLKNIILKYLPAGCDEALRTEVLFDLYRLREDITKHTMMEDRMLIPIVSTLETESAG